MASSQQYSEEAWRDRLLRTWFEIEDEGLDPAHLIAQWGGRKTSTAYAWKNGKCTPSTWVAFKLARNAAASGYPELLTMLVPDNLRLAYVDDEVRVTGTLTDNIRDLDEIEAQIWRAAEAGDVEALKDAARRLHDEADEIAAEATTDLNE